MSQEAEDANVESRSPRDRSDGEGAEWQNIFDAMPDMICVLDGDGRISRYNRSFRERLKLPPENIIGARCQDVLQAAGARPSGPPLGQRRETEMPAHFQADLEIGDLRFSATIVPLNGPEGDAAGAIRIYHEITDLEESIEKVIQARKMDAVGRLAGEIAHEINNPLLYIGNYLYLLSEELPPDLVKREYVDKIQGGVDKLTSFTRDLIDFSRPLSDEYLPVDIRTILGSALELMDAGLREKKIEVVRRFGCGGERVLGSGEKLRQVFVNLIQNAIDAMEQGGAVVITTVCADGFVTVTFEDNGVGISDENLRRIFDPFFTARKGSSKKGAGLGLAVCYNIVRRHGGGITAASKVGSGTTFTVTLPSSRQRS